MVFFRLTAALASLFQTLILGATSHELYRPLLEEKPIAIVIPSYCNANWYEQNLSIIFSQNYTNYRIFYIDDASDDDTAHLVAEYAEKYSNNKTFILIQNSHNLGPMANRYSTIHTYCHDYEIIVECDGDDWFLDKNVLQTVNEAYHNPNVWLTYGQLTSYPDERYGITRKLPTHVVEEGNYREIPHCPSMLRTYYAWLFKMVKLEDLLYDSQWVSRATDWSYMFPMLEMANGRIKYLDRVVYVVNRANTINMSKIKPNPIEGDVWSLIRNKSPYRPVLQKPSKKEKDDIDIIIRLTKTPLARLKHFLISAEQFLKHNNPQFIAIDENNITCNLTPQEKALFKKITVIPASDKSVSFGDLLHNALSLCTSKHVVLASDLVRFSSSVDLYECAQLLEDTGAYGFFLSLTPAKISQSKLLPCINIETDVHAWQFSFNKGKWGKVINFDATMYKTSDLVRLFTCEEYETIHTFNRSWKQNFNFGKKINLYHVGLCYKRQCVRL